MRSRGVLAFIAASSTLPAAIEGAEGSRPRGVAPEFAKFYKSTTSFACIHNPSIIIPTSRVNDDYCDCPDGSDEPGTSACSHLSPLSPPSLASTDPALNHTVALPGFHCKNKGHRAAYLPFTLVNDGICDYDVCCDGSDEWAGARGVKCPDRCKELGTAWRAQDAARQTARSAALAKRKQLVLEAARQRKLVEDNIANIKLHLAADGAKIAQAEQALVDVERREKLRAISAPKAGGKAGVLAALAQRRTNELKAGLLVQLQKKVQAEARVRELEAILDTFKTEYNPNFNDEGVKRAVRAWEDYEARGRAAAENSVEEKETQDLLLDDAEHGLNWAEFEGGEDESDTDSLYRLEAYLPPSLRDFIHQKVVDLKDFFVANGILPAKSPDASSGESKAVSDARAALALAQSEHETRKTELATDEEDLARAHGADDVFRALRGQCVSVESGEYVYEHCFLERTTQKPQKGGGMDTSMGVFSGIEHVDVDEDERADGRGLGSGRRVALRYENGAHCWNGPARSTTVILACAETSEIWKVVEEEKCNYRMEAGTPAACEVAVPNEAERANLKDEL